MEVSKVQYHLKIIFDGILFVFQIIVLHFCTTLMMIYFIIYGLKSLPTVKIKWDLNMSRKKFLELCGVSINVYIFFFMVQTMALGIEISIYCLNDYGRIALISYWLYIYHYHATTLSLSEKIGNMTFRNNIFGRHSRSYYPVELIKTAELEPNRNYIIASYPHGITGFAVVNNMLLDISPWMSLFPRVRPMIATLDMNFCIPICKRIFHAVGTVSASKAALLHYLRQSNDPKHPDNNDGFTSTAMGVAVGGVQEAEFAIPGTHKIVLKNRKGFIKVAILSGSSIVPSFSFGEVELFDQLISEPGSLVYQLQHIFKKVFVVWPTFMIGRGFFQNSFGMLPRKKRLVQVVGAPIDVVQSDKPDPKYVDEIHEKFVEAITELFETHKKNYLEDYENKHLVIT